MMRGIIFRTLRGLSASADVILNLVHHTVAPKGQTSILFLSSACTSSGASSDTDDNADDDADGNADDDANDNADDDADDNADDEPEKNDAQLASSGTSTDACCGWLITKFIIRDQY